MSRLVLTDDALSAGRAVARAYIKRFPQENLEARTLIETFLSIYETVRSSVANHHAAICVASAEALSAAPGRSVKRRFQYPESPGALFEHIEPEPQLYRAYFQQIQSEAQARVASADIPSVIIIGEKTHVLQREVNVRQLVGLDAEQQTLAGFLRYAFAYDPQSGSNLYARCVPKAVLLHGPPGTGKSCLIANLFAEGKRLAKIRGIPFQCELYDASCFSSYFGRSTRLLRKKMRTVYDPRGVGLFCIEDADMVLQSRSDKQSFHGALNILQYLINEIDGVRPFLGNAIAFFTSNRPEGFDESLQNRFSDSLSINPFLRIEAHASYFALVAPHLSAAASNSLAALSLREGLSGRDLDSIVRAAGRLSLAPPSDEELRACKWERTKNNGLSEVLLSELIVARKAARRTQE